MGISPNIEYFIIFNGCNAQHCTKHMAVSKLVQKSKYPDAEISNRTSKIRPDKRIHSSHDSRQCLIQRWYTWYPCTADWPTNSMFIRKNSMAFESATRIAFYSDCESFHGDLCCQTTSSCRSAKHHYHSSDSTTEQFFLIYLNPSCTIKHGHRPIAFCLRGSKWYIGVTNEGLWWLPILLYWYSNFVSSQQFSLASAAIYSTVNLVSLPGFETMQLKGFEGWRSRFPTSSSNCAALRHHFV